MDPEEDKKEKEIENDLKKYYIIVRIGKDNYMRFARSRL